MIGREDIVIVDSRWTNEVVSRTRSMSIVVRRVRALLCLTCVQGLRLSCN